MQYDCHKTPQKMLKLKKFLIFMLAKSCSKKPIVSIMSIKHQNAIWLPCTPMTNLTTWLTRKWFSILYEIFLYLKPRGGGVLRFELDRGVLLEPQNPYPSLRVILTGKGTHFLGFFLKNRPIFKKFCDFRGFCHLVSVRKVDPCLRIFW